LGSSGSSWNWSCECVVAVAFYVESTISSIFIFGRDWIHRLRVFFPLSRGDAIRRRSREVLTDGCFFFSFDAAYQLTTSSYRLNDAFDRCVELLALKRSIVLFLSNVRLY
jgi:hypothetical protein